MLQELKLKTEKYVLTSLDEVLEVGDSLRIPKFVNVGDVD